MWMDNMCIPKMPNQDNAHVFIDFILRPENSAIISEEIGYGSPMKRPKLYYRLILPRSDYLSAGRVAVSCNFPWRRERLYYGAVSKILG